MEYTTIETQFGSLLLAGQGEALSLISFYDDEYRAAHRQSMADWVPSSHCLQRAKEQLSEYFSGQRTQFDLELNIAGTAFQQLVLSAVSNIPYGQTKSYGEIAGLLGKPKAARAVGSANRSNRLPIVIPCHRVVGQDGRLVGYNNGGVSIKRKLIDYEYKHAQLL